MLLKTSVISLSVFSVLEYVFQGDMITGVVREMMMAGGLSGARS